jgi:predicted dehydrogenase
VRLGVFFQDRVQPDIARLHDLVAGGRLGRPLLASARVKWYRPPEYYSQSRWRGTWALDGGGALMNQGIHTVDLLQWVFGPVARVAAKTRTALHAIEVEDTAVALLEFRSGALATFEATTTAYPGYKRRVEFTGQRRHGRARARSGSFRPISASPPTTCSPSGRPTPTRAAAPTSSRMPAGTSG